MLPACFASRPGARLNFGIPFCDVSAAFSSRPGSPAVRIVRELGGLRVLVPKRAIAL